jgi:Methyltransferase FkbM domain
VPALDVKVVPLDALNTAGRRISFIKIDVEGGEFQVLKGSQRLLKEHHPVLFFEFSENFMPLAGISEEQLFNFLRELGYQRFIPFPQTWVDAGHHAHDVLALP